MIGFRSIAVATLVIFSIQDGNGQRFLRNKHVRADVQCTPPVGNDPVLLPNPDDCTTFYECNSMLPVLMHCPPNLLYCSELKSCRYITDHHLCAFSDCKLPGSTDVTQEATTVKPSTTSSTSEPITTPSTIRTTTIVTDEPTTITIPTTSTIRTPTNPPTTSHPNALCPAPAGNPTNLVPDPEDCRAFYECVGDTAIHEYCPTPLWFCNEEHICTYQNDALCRFNDCKKVAIKTVVVADPPTCPPPSGQGNVTLYPNAENCSTYYECDNGVLQTLDCPKGLLFCSEKSACSWSWDTECAHTDCQAVKLHEHGARYYAEPPSTTTQSTTTQSTTTPSTTTQSITTPSTTTQSTTTPSTTTQSTTTPSTTTQSTATPSTTTQSTTTQSTTTPSTTTQSTSTPSTTTQSTTTQEPLGTTTPEPLSPTPTTPDANSPSQIPSTTQPPITAPSKPASSKIHISVNIEVDES